MLIYMKKPLIFCIFALLTVGLAPAAIAAAASAQSLPVVIVQRHLVDLTFPAESLVEAVQQATVGAQVAGRVLEVKVDAGQVVKKGDLLMQIDAREAEEVARAAAAQYANAKLNYERTKTLKDQKFLSPAAVDKAKADFDSARRLFRRSTVSLPVATPNSATWRHRANPFSPFMNRAACASLPACRNIVCRTCAT